MGRVGIKHKITKRKMNRFNAGNITVIIAILLIAYALLGWITH